MHTQSVDTVKHNPPTLFGSASQVAGFILSAVEAERSARQSQDILEVLQKAADQTGFSYLFEVPGCLFDKIDLRVAAIRSGHGKNDADYFFILCDEVNGINAVLEFDDAPLVARDFFHSYTWVLSSLKDLNVVKNLH